jgi:hypothetical protein
MKVHPYDCQCRSCKARKKDDKDVRRISVVLLGIIILLGCLF